MIEFFKLKDDPNIIVIREKGARGPTKETRIDLLPETLRHATAQEQKRKKVGRK